MTHSSYKSLLVAFAITALGACAAGCALAPESETAQGSSSDLTTEHTIERGAEQPLIQPTTVGTIAPQQQNALVHPTAPRLLVLDGPKPNPWDDNNGTNSNAGSSGTGTGSNSK